MHSPNFFALVASALLLASAAHAQEAQPDPTRPPFCESSDPSCLLIEEDMGYELSDFGRIDFVAVTEDSRCPIDVLCFWEGQVKVELKHAYMGRATKFIVGLGSSLNAEYLDELSAKKIVLEQVWPEPNFAHPIRKPYQIKLRLENLPVAGEPSIDDLARESPDQKGNAE